VSGVKTNITGNLFYVSLDYWGWLTPTLLYRYNGDSIVNLRYNLNPNDNKWTAGSLKTILNGHINVADGNFKNIYDAGQGYIYAAQPTFANIFSLHVSSEAHLSPDTLILPASYTYVDAAAEYLFVKYGMVTPRLY
jgi:hypothetical protein